jgi:RNA-directed DNA polymerase
MVVNALEPQWEAKFEPTSYGFRPGKSYQDAIHRIHTLLGHKTRCWICDVDLEGCFNNIDHDYLLTQLDSFPYVDLIKKWLKAGIFLDGVYYQTETGTPQGGVLSPLLANIAMHGLESKLGIKYNNQGYITKRENPLYRTIIRYADDLIVVCPTREIALRLLGVAY